MTRFIPFAIVFASGCREINLECPPAGDVTIINEAPLADTADDVVEDDTATEDTGVDSDGFQPYLKVAYTTALSGYGDWAFQSGEQWISFGGFLFLPYGTEFTTLQYVKLQGFVSEGPGLFAYYQYGEDNGVRFVDHFTNCRLVNATTGTTVMGPVEPALDGTLTFDNEYTTELGVILNVVCDHTGAMAKDDVDGFSVDLLTDLDVSALDADGQYMPVAVEAQNGRDNPSTARILLPTDPVPDECAREVVTWNGFEVIDTLNNDVQAITLSSSSPSGTSVPGYGEVLRVNVANEDAECAELEVASMRLRITGIDNADTDWNEHIPNRGVVVYDLSHDGTTQTAMNTVGWYWDGNDVYVDLQGSFEIAPGSTTTFAVYIDSTGASTSQDDQVQVMLAENSLQVSDGSKTVTLAHDGVLGNVLTF